jgi:hypothetical protein
LAEDSNCCVHYFQDSFNLQDAIYTAALAMKDEKAITLKKGFRKLDCFHVSG